MMAEQLGLLGFPRLAGRSTPATTRVQSFIPGGLFHGEVSPQSRAEPGETRIGSPATCPKVGNGGALMEPAASALRDRISIDRYGRPGNPKC